MQSCAMTQVEIESLQSQQRPDADVYALDSSDQAMARSFGLNPCTHRLLEQGSHPQCGKACEYRHGDRSCEPPP